MLLLLQLRCQLGIPTLVRFVLFRQFLTLFYGGVQIGRNAWTCCTLIPDSSFCGWHKSFDATRHFPIDWGGASHFARLVGLSHRGDVRVPGCSSPPTEVHDTWRVSKDVNLIYFPRVLRTAFVSHPRILPVKPPFYKISP